MQSQIGCSVLSSAKIQDCSPAGSSSLNILQWSVEERSRPAGGGTRSRSWLPTVFGVDLFMPGNFATTNKGGFGRITQRITRRMESCTRLRVHQCLLLLPVASFFLKPFIIRTFGHVSPLGPTRRRRDWSFKSKTLGVQVVPSGSTQRTAAASQRREQ